MKRAIIISISVLLAIVTTLFGLRHAIIGHAFKVSISKKTNQTITFNIGNAHYSVINSSISFTNSDFTFSNTFLNKERTIELSEIKFDELKLEGLSLLHLLFKNELIASKFIISDPLLGFHENNNPIHFHEKPNEIIGSLEKHHDVLGNLTIIVDEIEITHGEVDIMSMLLGEEHDGSVEFTFLIKDFRTSKEKNDENRTFFAKNHFVKLNNFYYSFPNGDIISFDSIVLESDVNTIVTNNIRVEINSKSNQAKINPIIAEIDEIQVQGIDFDALERLHELVIDSIAITDGTIHLIQNENKVSKLSPDTLTKNKDFLGPLRSVNLSSLMLNNINVLNTSPEGDTIISLENLNLGVGKIQLDSTSIVNHIPNINYNTINLSSGNLKIIEKKSNLRISLESILFSEKSGIISLIGLKANEKSINAHPTFMAKIDSIEVTGASAESFVKKQPMNIGLLISNPIVELDLSNKTGRKTKKRNIDLDNFGISDIKILNGTINVFENNKLDLSVNGIDFNSGQIQLSDLKKIHEINTDNLSLNASSIKVHIPDKNLLFTSGPISLLNNNITINQLSGHIKDEAKINSSINVNQLKLGSADIGEIIAEKKINLDYIKIVRPRIDGIINLNSEEKGTTPKKPERKIDFGINIKDTRISEGKVDLTLNLKNEAIKLHSGVDITVENINFTNSSDTTWLKELLWKVNLSQPVVDFQDYLISCSTIVSDSKAELLSLENIKIEQDPDISIDKRLNINEISIRNINFSGLRYNTVLEKQTPIVGSISVESPYADIRIDSRISRTADDAKSKQKSITIPINLDEFVINNLSSKIEMQDSISISNLSLANLDLKYHKSSSDNIVDWLEYLRVVDFSYSDTIKNSFVNIKKLNINNQNVTFGDIKGGNINKLSKTDNHLMYASSGFEISGIAISQTIPHDIIINAINVKDFQIDIENHKTDNAVSSSSANKQIKLPGSLKSLDVELFSANNININHISITDTIVKKLELNQLGLLINSIKIDSTIVNDGDFQLAEQITVDLKGNKFVSSDSLYATSLNTINYNFSENVLSVDSLRMKPRYKPAEFFKKAVYQTGKMDLVVGKINCSNLRLKKLISDGSIHIGGVDVFGLDMRIFRNKKYKMDPELYKKMPQEALLTVPRVLTIDSIKTHKAFIQYKQLSKKSIVPGEIFLDDVYLSAFNINNNLKVIDETSSMVVLFKAKLLGASDLDLKLTLPILSPSYDFWVTGHLNMIDLTKLNSMTQNLVGVTMESGTGELEIPLISGNSIHSEGSILFKYKKLKIELYNRDHAENATGLGGSMANLLLNDIFIRSNNPGFNGKMRFGEVYFKRNTQKSIVYYTWKSILSGLMSTMGYNNKEQRHEKRALKHKSN